MKSVAIVAFLLVSISMTYSYIFSNSPSKRSRGLITRQLTPDEEQRLSSAKDELLKITGSINPFDWYKATILSKTISILREKKEDERQSREDEQRAREVEQRAREDERLSRDAEIKEVYIKILDSDNDEYSPREVDRAMFRQWNVENKFLYLDYKKVRNFDELIPGENYEYHHEKGTRNFAVFAEIEANIQTRDCVDAIIKDNSLVPPFGQPNTKVFIEKYSVSPPVTLNLGKDKKKLGFGFPIKPDALLTQDSTWLLLESKHAARNSDILGVLKKRNFLWEHRGEPWVHKEHDIPTRIIAVVSTVNDFSTTVEKDIHDACIAGVLVLLVRDELGYKRVENQSEM